MMGSLDKDALFILCVDGIAQGTSRDVLRAQVIHWKGVGRKPGACHIADSIWGTWRSRSVSGKDVWQKRDQGLLYLI